MRYNAKQIVLFLFLAVFFIQAGPFAAGALYGGSEASSSSHSIFSVKIMGGLNYLILNELNTYIDDNIRYLENNKDPGSVQGKNNHLHFGPNVEIDFVLHITPRIGICLGTGYINGSVDSGEITWTVDLTRDFMDSEIWKVRAIPIRCGLQFLLPLSLKLNLVLDGGAGYYLGHFSYLRQFETWAAEGKVDIKADKNVFGFYGGAALEYVISSKTAIFLQIKGKQVSFSGLEGEALEAGESIWGPFNETGTSRLYLYDLEDDYLILNWRSTPPDGPDEKNVRDGIFNLSGVSASIGFRISF
ncbi:MAG: hypothetical protein JXB26_19520 [Candidatus Aminicenantes bacterium]|nr:hypothetical protein [Candidatus Aminicenantes bacterium]